MSPRSLLSLMLLAMVCPFCAAEQDPAIRNFQFRYGFKLVDLPASAHVRTWIPLPQSNHEQQIHIEEHNLPAATKFHFEPTYGNRIAYCEQQAAGGGELPVSITYGIQRSEVRSLERTRPGETLADADRKQFLQSNRMVPLGGRPLDLLALVQLPDEPLARARALYDVVDSHVRYDKSKPGYGDGNVLWVCDSRFGNCTDFHSLFISLARTNQMPARFEIGFPLPKVRGAGKIGGYHCWARFYHESKGWIPVDISEADKHPEMKEYYFGNLTENRVAFTVGRDIQLVPPQQGPPLNYFVYPYVEVDGKPWPKDKIELNFSYEDTPDVELPFALPNVKHLIDTHIHLYDTERDVYEVGRSDRVTWPPVGDRILHKPHMPSEFHRVAKPAGCTAVVIVEASPRIDDNDWVLDLVADDDLFVGLVGNIDLFSADFPKHLDRLRKDPRFVGVRMHWMGRGSTAHLDAQLRSNLQKLSDAGLTLDVLMNGEGPKTVQQVAALAADFPKLRTVVNHVVGYNIDDSEVSSAWAAAIQELAQHKNVWVKISGLYQRSKQQPAPRAIQYFTPILDTLWDEFGADRLIYGSNWPCTKNSGDYASFVRLVNSYFSPKGPETCEKFFWQNAAKAYRLPLE